MWNYKTDCYKSYWLLVGAFCLAFSSGSAPGQERHPKEALGGEDPLQTPETYVEAQDTGSAVLKEAANVERPQSVSVLSEAEHYYRQGKYGLAEPLYLRTLAGAEKRLGPGHPAMGAYLSKLTRLYSALGKYAKAEALGRRALAIWEKSLGPDHPDVATGLNSLGTVHYHQGNYSEAEPLYRRALAISERVFGPDHPTVAAVLGNLAALYQAQSRYGSVILPQAARCMPITSSIGSLFFS